MNDIYLREIERGDLPSINSWRADQETLGQLGAPFRYVGVETDERWFENYLANRVSNVRLAICLANGGIAGVVYLLSIDWLSKSAEFAIWIGDRSAQGKKIGEKATRLALSHAFYDLNLQRIHLSVLPENKRAIGLYKKVGFVVEGVLRRAVFKQGQFRDLNIMAILKEEFSISS